MCSLKKISTKMPRVLDKGVSQCLDSVCIDIWLGGLEGITYIFFIYSIYWIKEGCRAQGRRSLTGCICRFDYLKLRKAKCQFIIVVIWWIFHQILLDRNSIYINTYEDEMTITKLQRNSIHISIYKNEMVGIKLW